MADTLRILYVDDEPDLLEIGKLFLEQSGDFKVTTIGSAAAALDLLTREQFDAIISDYQMPGLDGIQLLIEVRTKLGQVPFILFTGKGREEVVIQAINSGADFYLQKGGEPGAQFAELSHKIKQAALRNKAENSLRKSEEKYRLLIEHANEAIVVAQDGMLKLVNQRAIELTGYSEQELLSVPFSDIINHADRAIVMERYQKRLKGEELPSRYPFRVGSKEGSIYWVELSAVVIDWDGRPATLNFLSDVTNRKKAEEALRESESFNRGLVENLPDYIIVYRPDGKILYVNPATVKAFGYTAEELAGTPVLSYVAPECRNEVTANITARLERRDPPEYETVIITRNGQRKTVIAKGTLIHYHDGPATLLVLNDITVRKQTDELLRISEEKYRKVFFTSPDSICITRLHDGMFVSVNKGFTEITGYTEEDIAGKTSLEINIWKDPEDRRKIVEGLKAHGEVRDYEARFLTKTGEICGVMSTSVIELNGVPHILNITRDITGHKRAEETFRMSVERYKIISEMTTDFVFSCIKPDNGTYSIDWMTGAVERITGYTIKELIALECWRCLVLPEDALIFDENVTNLPAGTSGTCILRIQTKRGDTRWLEVHTSNNPSYPNRIFGGCRDITERKRVEEALRESRDRFRVTLASLDDAVFMVDPATRLISECNAAATRIFGYSREEMVGRATNFLHVDQAHVEQFGREARATYEDPGYYTREFEMRRRDGSIFSSEHFVRPVRTPDGQVLYVISVVRDITGHKQAEAALRESEERHRILLNDFPDPIFSLYPDGTYRHVNRAFATGIGKSVDQIIGKKIWDVFQKDEAERRFSALRTVFSTGEGKEIEVRVHHPDGDRYYVTTIVPVKDDKGSVVSAICSSKDITERKVAEEARQRSEEKHRLLIENSHDIIYTIDTEGLFIFVSPSWKTHLGHPVDQVIGKPFAQFVHPDDIIRCLQFMRNVFSTGKPQTGIEYRVKHIDGSWRWHITNAVPLQDEAGTIVGGEGSASDITERKYFENEMKSHEQELLEFSTSLATANKKLNLLSSITRHDINNQLTILKGYLTILEKKQPDTTHNEYFQKISTAAKRISSMIQFSGEYEKIGVNAPVWQDCRTLVDTAAKEAPLGKVMVKNELPAGTEVFADPLIARVFFNLMDNAVRYGGKITTLRFSAPESGDDLLIVCEDDGVGVVVAEKEKIFEREFGKNTGMGLALSREILDITAITIRETGEPGQGARFEITVPKGMWRVAGKSN